MKRHHGDPRAGRPWRRPSQPARFLGLLPAFLVSLELSAALLPVPELGLQVQAGFRVGLMAPPGLADDVQALAVDARGRAVVASGGYLKTLLDENDDGVAEDFRVLAEFPGPVHGLAFHHGTLMITAGDGLYALLDVDQDGVSEGPPREVLGLPAAASADGLGGIRLGPDGWWYLGAGRTAGLDAAILSSPSSPVSSPRGGGVFRLSPDQSRLECVAHGLNRPWPMDFHGNGDLLVADGGAWGQEHLPWYVPARLIRVLSGGHYGFMNVPPVPSQPWPFYYPDLEVSLSDLGSRRPSGLVIYRHYQFPEFYRNGAFLSDWASGSIWFYRLQPAGTTYEAGATPFLEPLGRNGFAPSGLAVAPDGSLWIATGGRQTRGGIYRVQFAADAAHVVLATNWIQTSATPLDAAMIAPQPLEAWSRDYWEPVLDETDPAVLKALVVNPQYTAPLRVRAMERLTELFGGLDRESALAAARDSVPEIRARAAWSMGRVPCEGCLPLLLALTRDAVPWVRQHALSALGQRSSELSMTVLQQALGANLVHPDPAIRRLAARLIPALSEPAWQALRQHLQTASIQARLTALQGAMGREGENPVRPDVVREALDLFAQTNDPALRLQSLRLILSGLGGTGSSGPEPELFLSFVPAQDLQSHSNLVHQLADRIDPVFPTGSEPVDLEIARLLGLVKINDSTLAGRLLSQVTQASAAGSDFHYLTVLARLPAPTRTNLTDQVAHAYLRLASKRAWNTSTNSAWVARHRELAGQLLTGDPRLVDAFLRHPDLAHPAHAPIVPLLGPENFLAAARRFLVAIQTDPAYPAWTLPVVDILSTMPLEVVRPHFRRHWTRGDLRALLVAKLGEKPEETDRDKFLWALESSDWKTVAVGVKALRKLPADPSRTTLLGAMRLLRRLLPAAGPTFHDLRAGALDLVGHESGLNIRITEPENQSLAVGEAYRPVFEWFARTYPAWHRRLDEVDGLNAAAWELKLKSVRWDQGRKNRGRLLYENLGCRQCHDAPHPLGPDLTGLGSRRSREEIWEALLFPSRHADDADRVTVIRTTDGQEFRGAVVYETAEMILVQAGRDQTWRLAAPDIVARFQDRPSRMPAGLLEGLAPADLADLHQYLLSR